MVGVVVCCEQWAQRRRWFSCRCTACGGARGVASSRCSYSCVVQGGKGGDGVVETESCAVSCSGTAVLRLEVPPASQRTVRNV